MQYGTLRKSVGLKVSVELVGTEPHTAPLPPCLTVGKSLGLLFSSVECSDSTINLAEVLKG